FGVDYAFVFLGLAISTRSGTGSSLRTGAWRPLWLGRLVHLLSQLLRGLGQVLAGTVHRAPVGAFECLLGVSHRVLDLAALGAGNLVAVLPQHFLHAVDHGVELIARLDLLTLRLVLSRVRVGLFGHAFDFILAQARRGRDR